MTIEQQLRAAALEAINELYGAQPEEKMLQVQLTRKDQKGDFTIVVFPLLKVSKKKPEETGEDLGRFIQKKLPMVVGFEVVKGFLNLSLSPNFWVERLNELRSEEHTSELQSRPHLVCRLLLEKKNKIIIL